MSRTVLLFPGQGAHLPGSLAGLITDHPAAGDLLMTVDKVAAEYGVRPVSPLLTDPGSPDIDALSAEPEVQNVLIFATAVSLFEILRAEGLDPDVLAGHSGGEIAALTAAGALTIEDGTRVACARSMALRAADLPPAGMLAVEAGAARTAHLLAAVDDWTLAVAAHNAPSQTAVSGLENGLRLVEKVAAALGLRSTRLATPHPYHSPVLAAAARHFVKSMNDIPVQAPARRVYSPIAGSWITTAQEASQLLAGHFTRPVRYVEAIRSLHADGVTTFVEGGARQTLTGLVTQILPPQVRVMAPLARRIDTAGLRQLVAAMGVGDATEPGTVARRPAAAPVQPPVPEPAPAVSGPATVSGAAVASQPTGDSNGALLPADGQLLTELQQIFAGALGYPTEVFTEDAELEAELGVSSVKQVEIFAKILDRYQLPDPPAEIRLRSFSTLPRIAELLRKLADEPETEGRP